MHPRNAWIVCKADYSPASQHVLLVTLIPIHHCPLLSLGIPSTTCITICNTVTDNWSSTSTTQTYQWSQACMQQLYYKMNTDACKQQHSYRCNLSLRSWLHASCFFSSCCTASLRRACKGWLSVSARKAMSRA